MQLMCRSLCITNGALVEEAFYFNREDNYMSYTFYKWIGIITLVFIGILRLFDLSTTNRIIVDTILYAVVIISFIVYYRKKFKAEDK